MQDVEAARTTIAGKNVRGGVTLGMPDVQSRAGRVGEHVENVKLLRELRGSCGFSCQIMANSKWMPVRHGVAGIERAESLLLLPGLLPLGFDEMEWVLSAAARHKAGSLRRIKQSLKCKFAAPEGPG